MTELATKAGGGTLAGAPARVGEVAWRPVLGVATAVMALLLVFANRYGYHADELYFRMLGERGLAWGYTDQPPALPAVVHLAAQIFGDTLWGIRVPAILCAGAITVLGTLVTVELGGGRRAQLLAAFGLGTSMLVLTFGHWILTSSLDTVAWLAVLLFTLRALLRDGGRWWVAAGATVGVALYAKYIILLLPVAVLLGMLLVGPRHHFRQRWLYLGMVAALAVGAPNLIYQLVNDLPQMEMARGLGDTDGSVNRQMFLQNLVFLRVLRVLRLAHQALAEHLHLFAEGGRGEALAPHLAVQRLHDVGAAVLRQQRPVGLDAARERRGVEPLLRHLGQRALEDLEPAAHQRAAGSHRMPAELGRGRTVW